MHPTTAELLEHLDTNRVALREEVERVPPPFRERRPGPDRWSVAEVLEHLALVEDRLVHIVTSQATGASVESAAKDEGGRSVVQSLDTALILDRNRRLPASEMVTPRAGLDAATALSRLEAVRRRLREAILARDGQCPGEFRLQHPLLGPLDLNQCIAFAGSHEARHTAQIREIGAALAAGA